MALLSTALPRRALPTISLSFVPASVLTVVAGAVGAGLDTAHGAPARALFAAFLALGAVVAVAAVPRTDVVRVVVLVPLAYFGLLVVGGLAAHDGGYAAWLASAFIIKAPVVLIATAAATVAAVARRVAR